MYVRYGSFTHALNEAAVSFFREPLTTQGGLQYGCKETWNISGFKQADTRALLAAALTVMEFAYSQNQQTLALLDDNLVVVRQLLGRTSLGGTTVRGGVSYPNSGERDAEFASTSSFRRFQVTVEGVYALPGVTDNLLLAWTELLTFTGGGPRFVHLQPLNGLPQKQLVAESTPYRVTQVGSAIGLRAWPSPPSPIWPAAEKQWERRITPKHPKRSGGLLPVYTDFEVDWVYEFEDRAPLNGVPTLWR